MTATRAVKKNMKMKMTVAIGIAFITVGQASSHAIDVQELWSKNCASCHGKDGRGQTPAGKKAGVVNLTDSAVQEKFSDDEMFKAVKEGRKDGDKVKMKPAERLTDREIKALISHVRTLKK